MQGNYFLLTCPIPLETDSDVETSARCRRQ